MTAYQSNGRNRNVRRYADEARRLAVEGRWQEAIELNQMILGQSPRDVDALNRLGKAYTETGQLQQALETYRQVLEIDSSNTIARRNVERLELLVESGRAEAASVPAGNDQPVSTRVFIEEVGKTYVTDLHRPGDPAVLAQLWPADEVELRAEDKNVAVYDAQGRRLGRLEPRIAQRLIRLWSYGNRYRAFVVSLNGNTVRIILREVYHNPDSPEKTSFPRQAKIPAPRPYLRESARRQRELEPDLLLEEDDEEEDEETDDAELEEVEGVDDESDDDAFLTDGALDDEDETTAGR